MKANFNPFDITEKQSQIMGRKGSIYNFKDVSEFENFKVYIVIDHKNITKKSQNVTFFIRICNYHSTFLCHSSVIQKDK